MTHESLRETYMKRCLDLALHGLGNTAPNPMVGAVIVYNGRIIGEGFHQKFGESHAEVNAINAVSDKKLLWKSTIYVNLEPCSHTGKTPPCTDLIINSRIPEVVVGITDPNPLVSGKGLQKLSDAGVRLVSGVLPKECSALNKRFITYHTKKRPYILLKWAQTNDGFIDVVRNPSDHHITWISNEISRMLVHKWRSEEQSILVGTNTALMDNPRLNVREWPGNSPIRLVIDRNLKCSKNLNIFDNQSPTIVFNAVRDMQENQTNYVCMDFNGNFLEHMMKYLYEAGIQSVLVEGGRTLIEHFIHNNLWDEARVFQGKKQFGSGVPAPVISAIVPEEFTIREDLLMLYRNIPKES